MVTADLIKQYDGVNPLDVLARIEQIQAELETLGERWTRSLAAKQALLDAAAKYLVPSHDALRELAPASGEAEAALGRYHAAARAMRQLQ